MTRTTIATLLLLLAFLCAVGSPVTADEGRRWVTADNSSLKGDRSASAPDVVPLPVGTELAVVEDAGRWLKVRTLSGEEGWIFAGRVSETKPSADGGGNELLGGLTKQGTIQTARSDSARSIRGLSPETTQYAKNRGTPEQLRKELDRILARAPQKKKLESFLREARLGEFAE